VLDRNQRIMLPVEQPVVALERLIALDQAQDLLARDVVAVDLRLQRRPSLRLAPYSLAEMRRLRGIIPAESDL
jgi:cell division protein FtsQ